MWEVGLFFQKLGGARAFSIIYLSYLLIYFSFNFSLSNFLLFFCFFLIPGATFWRYDEKKQKFDCGYPRLITPIWKNVPRDIDAVYSGSGGDGGDVTFFVKGNDMFIFDDE